MATRKKKSEAAARPSDALDRDTLLWMMRDMARQRRMEEGFARSYGMGKIYGFCHLYIGQEAVSTGSVAALQPDDLVVSAYRIHGQALSKGMSMQAIADELYGRGTGCVGGVGGSMHLFDVERGFLGGWGLVGQQVPMGVGIAFAQKAQKTGKVTLIFMGDGAMQQGAIHEALNYASIWDIPCVFILENNQYGMGTAVDRVSAFRPFHRWASTYNMDHGEFDGMDVLETYDALHGAVARAREASRPTFLEARCARFRGHSMSDPGKYRSKEQLEEEKARDPIVKLGRVLEERGVATAEEIEAIDREAKDEIREVLKQAEQAPWPAEETIWRHIVAEEHG